MSGMNRTEVQQEWFGGLGLLTSTYGTITECSAQTCTEAKERKVVTTSSSQKTHTHTSLQFAPLGAAGLSDTSYFSAAVVPAARILMQRNGRSKARRRGYGQE